MNQATISLRIGYFTWTESARRAELLELLARQRATIGEVAFFTSYFHPPRPYEDIARDARILAGLIPQFRALGLRTGINHLSTFGHLDENLENALNEPWQRMTDINGTVAKGSFCPLDPRFQQYVRDCYRVLAGAGPDFIWIDDDVRMIHHAPAEFCCFCPLCLARFSEETGEPWTIELAREVIHPEGAKVSREVRVKWVAHNRRILDETFALIRAAVDEVDPGLILGFMPNSLLYEGMGFRQWGATLAGSRNLPVKWRPGGGLYTDAQPLEMIRKAHKMGRTAAAVPAGDWDIQYEHENFPYQRLKKSETVFIGEIGAALAAGCTGAALNVMGISPDPFDEYLSYFDRVAEARPFFDRIVSLAGRSACEGLWPAITPDIWAACLGAGGIDRQPCIEELAEIGLPPAYSHDGSCVSLLAGEAVLAFGREELQKLLAGAVLMDGQALKYLQELGLADLAGFEVAGTRDRDTIERFTADPLNGPHAGWWRDCRPSFWRTETYFLRPLGDQGRPLADLIDFNRVSAGPVMGIFENRLGGRVAVQGYYPWTSLQNLAKTTQLKNLCRWLSRDRLPAYVSSFHKATLWCRRGPGGELVIPFMNVSLDAAKGVRVHILDSRPLRMTRLSGREEPIKSSGADGPYQMLELPDLDPLEMALIHCG